jgi:hypothetical protein
MSGRELSTLLEIKQVLRGGKYVWPGGYPQYFLMSDGEAMTFEAVRQEWKQIVAAHLNSDRRSGWHIHGVDVNWEDPNLFCAHTNVRIESAYAEPEPEPAAA